MNKHQQAEIMRGVKELQAQVVTLQRKNKELTDKVKQHNTNLIIVYVLILMSGLSRFIGSVL